jgi:hypothetical protein
MGGGLAAPAVSGGSMSEDFIRIEKLENGFEVECLDPAQEEKNAKGKGWSDPYLGYAFSTKEEVLAFIEKKLGGMKTRSQKGEYDKAFKEASTKS